MIDAKQLQYFLVLKIENKIRRAKIVAAMNPNAPIIDTCR